VLALREGSAELPCGLRHPPAPSSSASAAAHCLHHGFLVVRTRGVSPAPPSAGGPGSAPPEPPSGHFAGGFGEVRIPRAAAWLPPVCRWLPLASVDALERRTACWRQAARIRPQARPYLESVGAGSRSWPWIPGSPHQRQCLSRWISVRLGEAQRVLHILLEGEV